jgi:anti-sigma-K factor RskA
MTNATHTRPPGAPHRNEGGGQHPAPEDLVLYAMQLLRDSAAAPIEQHVRNCQTCREELGRIHGDLAALALTTEPANPGPAARARLLAQVAREKKIVTAPIVKAPVPVRQEAKPAPIPVAETPLSLAEFGRGKTSMLTATPVEMAARRHPLYSWAGWVVAATLAVVSGLLYVDHHKLVEDATAQRSTIDRMNTLAQNSRRLMDALTDPEAVRVTLAPKAPPHAPVAGVTYNPKKGTLILLASNLDPLRTYKTYELWIIRADGSAPVPAGTFHPDEHGNASVVLPNLPKNVRAKAFGVTIEDAGGANKPTMPIIMAGS